MPPARYVRIYADAAGETHFVEVEQPLAPQDYAPPAPPLQIAALAPALRCGLVGAPTDWGGAVPHPSPRRQFFCAMQGVYEITASDGAVRRFGPGSLLLLEDTTGKGHATRIVGEEDTLVFAVAVGS